MTYAPTASCFEGTCGGCPRCSESDLTPEQIDADLEDQAARIEETTCA